MSSDNEKVYPKRLICSNPITTCNTLHGMHEVLSSQANTGKRVVLQPSLLFAACLQRTAGQCEPLNACHTLLFLLSKLQKVNFSRQKLSDQTFLKPVYKTKKIV